MPNPWPSIDEMIALGLQGRGTAPIWTPSEVKSVQAAREALRAVPMSGSISSVFEALRICIPFACGLLDTVTASRPFEPIDVLYRVPEAFIGAVADLVEMDPSPLVAMRLPIGYMCRPTDFMTFSAWRKMALVDAIYPHHGIDFPSFLTISSAPRGFDRELTTLWFFNECDGRTLTNREMHMVEALYGDILAAINRLRLPFFPQDSLRDQIVREQNSGYALIRPNGDLFECNHRALAIAQRYGSTVVGGDERALLSRLVHWAQSAPLAHGFSAKYISSRDKTTLLEISLHQVAREYNVLADDLTLAMFRETPVRLMPLDEHKPSIVEYLSPRRRQVATFLVNSGLSFKEIADELEISESTLRKHAEQIYRGLKVRSRAELVALFK
ncbi:MAG TPA: LuxR C-terminal-related transcriptional regulator [Polyangium sp.]|nr:LuxR C-terminal-related transcriptional regulator [Polyangium sp.]